MTCKAVCTGYFVNTDTAGEFQLTVSIAGIVSGNLVNTTHMISGIDPAITSVNLEAAIKTAVKDHLTNSYGYSFGLFDTVRLIGALL